MESGTGRPAGVRLGQLVWTDKTASALPYENCPRRRHRVRAPQKAPVGRPSESEKRDRLRTDQNRTQSCLKEDLAGLDYGPETRKLLRSKYLDAEESTSS